MVIKKDKHGWIKVMESFLAITLIIAIILVVINNKNTEKEDASVGFYNLERSLLKEIQLNDTLRTEIVSSTGQLDWNDVNFPQLTKAKITSQIPAHINCTAKICLPADLCVLTDNQLDGLGIKEKDIYADSMMLTSTLKSYSPKVIKIFCWD